MTRRKCYECGGELCAQRKDYNYKECGLANVILKGITVYSCPRCGSEEPEIDSMAGLHRAIMIEILKKETILCGEEIRYLRKMARMTAAQLAKLVGTDSTTLSKWETGKRKLGSQSDRVLRLICYSGMLERLFRINMAGDMAKAAQERKTMSIREILSKIEDKSRGPKKVTIDPAKLAEFVGFASGDTSSGGDLIQ